MGPAIMPEHVGGIRSSVSDEESAAWAEERESGRASEDAGGSDACSSVARGPAIPEVLERILAAIGSIDAGESEVARARLLALAEALAASGHAGVKDGVYAAMRSQGTDRQSSSEAAALLDLLRDVRDELRYLRQDYGTRHASRGRARDRMGMSCSPSSKSRPSCRSSRRP